jgi:hypothetical protein
MLSLEKEELFTYLNGSYWEEDLSFLGWHHVKTWDLSSDTHDHKDLVKPEVEAKLKAEQGDGWRGQEALGVIVWVFSELDPLPPFSIT